MVECRLSAARATFCTRRNRPTAPQGGKRTVDLGFLDAKVRKATWGGCEREAQTDDRGRDRRRVWRQSDRATTRNDDIAAGVVNIHFESG